LRHLLPRLLPLALAATLAACENQSPAALDETVVPVGPITVEVHVPWSQFATNLQVFGGFGSPHDLIGRGYLANQYQGTLNARTLDQFFAFPTQTTVNDSTGTSLTDSNLTFIGGDLMVRFDADASTNTKPVKISLAQPTQTWDSATANWTNAVDSLGVKIPWAEPGGGPVVPLASTVWDKAQGDSILIHLDSATVAILGDTAVADSARARGVRLSLDTPGERLQIKFMQLELTTRPSVHRDTLVTLVVDVAAQTFLYTPTPTPPTTGLRVGGIPAYRSTLTLALPKTVQGSADACAHVQCPLQLTADRITHAGLVLTTKPVEAAFRPTDSLGVQARTVLSPLQLPKSPIGDALFTDLNGRIIGASVPFAGFALGTPKTVEVPLTPVIKDLVSGKTTAGIAAPSAIALMSLRCPTDLTVCYESSSLTYAAFAGPGEPGEPYLRLVLTVSGKLDLP
jgi:hypothetical protein